MSREVINVGAAPNDGQGDPIRTSFIKTNNNFGELYARAQENPPATLVGTVDDVAGMYAYDSTYFYYCFQDYDGSSVIWAQITNDALATVNQIINGTSDIDIPTANGNITVSVANVANVAVFSSGGANFTAITASSAVINGDLTVTGNASLTGNVVGDRIVNGTTSVEIPVASGNATVTVGGTSNVAVFTNSGLVTNVVSATGNINGSVVSASGNIIGSNLVGGNLVLPTGSKISGDFSSLPQDGRTFFQSANTTANSYTFISAVPGNTNIDVIRSGFGALSTADLANSAVFGVYSYSNIGAVRSLGRGTSNANPIAVVFENTEVARFTSTGNLGLGNSSPVDRLAVNGNVYVGNNLYVSQSVSAVGNATAGNFLTLGLISATGNVNTGSTVIGNVLVSSNYIKTQAVAFASLPSAATAGAGARSFITDSNDITFAANAAGGGANSVPVFSDGTVWKIG